MNLYALFSQLLELVLALLLAPLLTGWINQCRAWLQNRSAPPLLQTYFTLHKLFAKEVLPVLKSWGPQPARQAAE